MDGERMTEKRFIRILDYSEKEVRIFDEDAQKNLFNIFFMEIDSAICLHGALEDTVDLLNELNDKSEFLEIENESLEDGATRYAELYHKSLKENEQLKQQIEELEFRLRTIEAYDRTVKEEHSDTVYDFKKKLEKW